jgi:Family of unknown function (DUF6152)
MTTHIAKMINTGRLVLAAVAMAITTTPAWAHHSASGYDMTKTETSEATIKEFRWSAPHSAVVVTIKGPDGNPRDVIMTTAPPTVFVRQGFQPKDFKAGDKLEISWHPTRSGAPGGILSGLRLPDGRQFKGEFGPLPPIGNPEGAGAVEREKQ